MEKWHIFFISWVAWAGKWTAIKWLLNEKINNLELALSCKTREPRKWEILWIDYNKLWVEEFKAAIEAWEFLEYHYIENLSTYCQWGFPSLQQLPWVRFMVAIELFIYPFIMQKELVNLV